MELPLQITFRNMDPSAAVEERVRERVQRLEQFYDRIIGCRVVIEKPHRHHHQGKVVHVRIDVTLPKGGELIVNREPEENHAHEDAFVAVRDAFDAMQRQVQEYARKHRGEVKTHEPPRSAES